MAGVYREQDHIPYMIGTMIFGGLVVVPITYGILSNIPYQDSLVPALVSCGIFLFAHDNRGNISFFRLFAGIAIVMFTVMRASVHPGNSERPFFLAGGLLGFVLMAGCGWLGIAIGRALRGKERLAQEVQQEQAAARAREEDVKRTAQQRDIKTSAPPAAVDTPDDEDFQPGDSPFEKLISQTQVAWKAGELNPLNKVHSREARQNSPRAFMDGHRKYQPDIDRACGLRLFDNDEFLVCLQENHFVLTSKALYLFRPAEQVILLSSMKTYKSSGVMSTKLIITTDDDERRQINGVKFIPEDEYVHYLMKQPYNTL